MPLILGANSLAGGYQIKNSARFNIGSSDFLEKTLSGTSTNRKLCTFSFWVKRSDVSDTKQGCIGGFLTNSSGQNLQIGFYDNGFYAVYYDGTIVRLNLVSSALARDVSAWYHVVVAIDTTQATTSNRVKMYVNGVQLTSFTTSDYPVQNIDFPMTNGFTTHIGKYTFIGSTTEYFSGYLSEVYFIDGQQLTPSSFGETDEDSGIWKPKAYTGTYGTNGFYLQFKNSASLGTDSSGNGNTFTVNNLTSVDQSTDTPTNNFATMNPLFGSISGKTYTEGNTMVKNSVQDSLNYASTIAVSSGKWYCEVTATNAEVNASDPVGILSSSSAIQTNGSYVGGTSDSYGWFSSGDINNNGSNVGTATTYTANDVLGLALDLDSGTKTLKLYKNGTLSLTVNITVASGDSICFGCRMYYTNRAYKWNFGNPSYSANSYTDGAGYGNFSYAVPSGYYALCTKNLATFG